MLNADLDLQVLDPSNTVVAASSSFQNSSEVVDFTPSVTGTYTLRVHSFRFDSGTSTFYGLAWNPDAAKQTGPLTGAIALALNSTKTNQTTNRGHSFWESYSAGNNNCNTLLNPETGLEKVYTFTTTHTGTISASLSSIVAFAGVPSNIDIALVKNAGAGNTLNQRVITCGDTSLSAANQPAGKYLLIVDGRQPAGKVASVVKTFSVTLNVT